MVESSMQTSQFQSHLLGGTTGRGNSAAFSNNEYISTSIALDGAAIAETLDIILAENNLSSFEELAALLQTTEDHIFTLYKDVQQQSEEVEKMEMHIRYLEADLEVQLMKVDELEAHNDQVLIPY